MGSVFILLFVVRPWSNRGVANVLTKVGCTYVSCNGDNIMEALWCMK
jgi:hypothetical protein